MKSYDPRAQIQNAMREAFPQTEGRLAQFYAMQQYQLGWYDEQLSPTTSDPGKLVRPLLSLLACQAAGGAESQALPLAAAIQLIHDFSLIHDDIEDQSSTRRGRPTVWTLWGLAQGINCGDGMLLVAHLSAHRMSELGVPAEIVLEVLKRFDQTILTVCEGQFLDLSFEGDLTITEADYLSMISRKTAALIAAASGLGAIVGGADVGMAESLFDFGMNLGLAFQVQDDVLGIWGDPAVTGKPAAADLYRRKVSLPIVHTLSLADHSEALSQFYRQTEISDDDVVQILRLLDAAGARGYTEDVAEYYHRQALAAIDRARGGNPQALAAIRSLAEGLLGRKN